MYIYSSEIYSNTYKCHAKLENQMNIIKNIKNNLHTHEKYYLKTLKFLPNNTEISEHYTKHIQKVNSLVELYDTSYDTSRKSEYHTWTKLKILSKSHAKPKNQMNMMQSIKK